MTFQTNQNYNSREDRKQERRLFLSTEIECVRFTRPYSTGFFSRLLLSYWVASRVMLLRFRFPGHQFLGSCSCSED